MKSKLSNQEVRGKIKEFFKNINKKSPKEIKKIKRLAMHYHISLQSYKKNFCKKCFSVFTSENSEIRIKNKMRNIRCKKCGYVTRENITKDL